MIGGHGAVRWRIATTPRGDQEGEQPPPGAPHVTREDAESDEHGQSEEEAGDDEDNLKDFPGTAEVEGVGGGEPHAPGNVKEDQSQEDANMLSQPILVAGGRVGLAHQALVDAGADEEAGE